MVDESPTIQDKNFKKEGLTLVNGTIWKVKKKPLPPNLKYETPDKKRDKDKIQGKWLWMFKWRPKDDVRDLKDIELKEAPSWFRRLIKVKLTDFKQSVAWEETHMFWI